MRIFFFITILILFLFNNCLAAYTPTLQDQKMLTKSYKKIDTIIKNDQDKAKQIMNKSKEIYSRYEDYTRMYFIFSSLYNYINSHKTRLSEIPKNNELLSKKDFFVKHWSGLSDNLPSNCFEKVEIIDKIAKQENIPTALIISMWKIEHNCFFDNPANWHWIFQLYSKNYGTWEVTEDWFKQQIYDFIAITKWKVAAYNKNKKYWTWELNIYYDKFDIDSLRIFAFLYNWIKKDQNPWNSFYVNGNINPDYSYKKDWFIVTFLKALKREIER